MNQIKTLPKNLILIGFMGSGKSAVGRELHQRLGYPLVDMDQLIENRAGKSISQIFSERGEATFRQLETELLIEQRNQKSPRRIISTGGGVIGAVQNRTIIREMGYVVWLHAPVSVIHERTSKNRDRPLLDTQNPLARIEALMEVRKPLYEEVAHLKIGTAGLDCGEIATGIIESARYFFAAQSK